MKIRHIKNRTSRFCIKFCCVSTTPGAPQGSKGTGAASPTVQGSGYWAWEIGRYDAPIMWNAFGTNVEWIWHVISNILDEWFTKLWLSQPESYLSLGDWRKGGWNRWLDGSKRYQAPAATFWNLWTSVQRPCRSFGGKKAMNPQGGCLEANLSKGDLSFSVAVRASGKIWWPPPENHSSCSSVEEVKNNVFAPVQNIESSFSKNITFLRWLELSSLFRSWAECQEKNLGWQSKLQKNVQSSFGIHSFPSGFLTNVTNQHSFLESHSIMKKVSVNRPNIQNKNSS